MIPCHLHDGLAPFAGTNFGGWPKAGPVVPASGGCAVILYGAHLGQPLASDTVNGDMVNKQGHGLLMESERYEQETSQGPINGAAQKENKGNLRRSLPALAEVW